MFVVNSPGEGPSGPLLNALYSSMIIKAGPFAPFPLWMAPLELEPREL